MGQVVAVVVASVVDQAVGIVAAVEADRVAGIVVAVEFDLVAEIVAAVAQVVGTAVAGFAAETSFLATDSVPASWQLGVVQTSQELELVFAGFALVPSWPPVAGQTNQEQVVVVAVASCLLVAAAADAVAKEDTCCHSHQQPANKHYLDCCHFACPMAVEFVAAA